MYTIKLNDSLSVKVHQKNGKWEVNGLTQQTDIVKISEHRFHVLLNNRSFEIELLSKDYSNKQLDIVINGKRKKIVFESEMDALLKSMGLDKAMTVKNNDVKAPMPGLVLKILVSEGQEVKKGDGLLVLEAMKMENILKSHTDGSIKKIHIAEKTAVEKNQILFELN
jgi:biotin carboxyl carrier protein